MDDRLTHKLECEDDFVPKDPAFPSKFIIIFQLGTVNFLSNRKNQLKHYCLVINIILTVNGYIILKLLSSIG